MPDRELEREYLDRLARARPDLPLTAPEHGDAPDFIVRLANRRIGIEVTRFSPNAEADGFIAEEQEALRERVLALARAGYEAGGGPPLHVHALFVDHRPLRRARVASLAAEIVALLLAKAITVLEYENVPFSRGDQPRSMHEIGRLSATRVPTIAHGVWYAGRAGWVRRAELADFTRVLSAKEPHVAEYRRKAEDIWLLVVFEMLPGGTHVELPSQLTFEVETAFDRVFALDRISGRCHELRIARPSRRGE